MNYLDHNSIIILIDKFAPSRVFYEMELNEVGVLPYVLLIVI